MPTKIAVRNLHLAFNGLEVLRGLDLDVELGGTLVVMGQSGCGKSVLLKCMLGLIRPDAGSIVIDGEDVTRLSEERLNAVRRQFGMLFQGAALFDSLSVGENVAFPLVERRSCPPGEIPNVVRRKLEAVGLAGTENMRPSQLSGGMKKRVGLARALAMDPEVIFYDEPTTGLDPVVADQINDLIVKLKRERSHTAVVVTHDIHSACRVADRMVLLSKGRIEAEGSPEEMRGSGNALVRAFFEGSGMQTTGADSARGGAHGPVQGG